MSVLFLEAGTNATYGLEFFDATAGTVSSSTNVPRLGSRSLRLVDQTSVVASPVSAIGTTDGHISFYVYFTGATGGSSSFFKWDQGTTTFNISRNSSNQLVLRDGTTARATSAGAVLPQNTWLHIEIAYSRTSSSVNQIKIWVAETIAIDASNVTWTETPDGRLRVTGESSGDMYFDSIYGDDTAGLSQIGNINVTAKLPATNNTSGFDTGVGASPSSRFENVDDRALSTATGWQHAAATDAQENYTLQTASAGDVDITGATILGYTGWVYGKRGDYDLSVGVFVGSVNSKT